MVIHVDLSLLALVIFLNVVGVWLARAREDWVVPITIYLGLLGLILASAWGFLTGEGFVTYGLPNGVMAWVMCTALYDVVHESFVKRKDRWSGLLSRLKAVFTRKKKEAKA